MRSENDRTDEQETRTTAEGNRFLASFPAAGLGDVEQQAERKTNDRGRVETDVRTSVPNG